MKQIQANSIIPPLKKPRRQACGKICKLDGVILLLIFLVQSKNGGKRLCPSVFHCIPPSLTEGTNNKPSLPDSRKTYHAGICRRRRKEPGQDAPYPPPPRLLQDVRSEEKHLNEGSLKTFLFRMKQRKRGGSRRPAFTRSCIFPRTGDSRSRLKDSSFLKGETFFWGGTEHEGPAFRALAGRLCRTLSGRQSPFRSRASRHRRKARPCPMDALLSPVRSSPLLLTPAHACRGPEKRKRAGTEAPALSHRGRRISSSPVFSTILLPT